jgi:hypothetical protein
MRLGWSALHIPAFLLSIYLLFHYRLSATASMLLLEVVILYVIFTNLTRREILPALALCVAFKIIEAPVSLYLYDITVTNILLYLFCIAAFDAVMAVSLLKFYRSDSARRLFRVDTPRLKIPQVNALVVVIWLGVFHVGLVMCEVLLYQTGLADFEGVPFFYNTFSEVRASHKILFMLGVWSIMLDAMAHPIRNSPS